MFRVLYRLNQISGIRIKAVKFDHPLGQCQNERRDNGERTFPYSIPHTHDDGDDDDDNCDDDDDGDGRADKD